MSTGIFNKAWENLFSFWPKNNPVNLYENNTKAPGPQPNQCYAIGVFSNKKDAKTLLEGDFNEIYRDEPFNPRKLKLLTSEEGLKKEIDDSGRQASSGNSNLVLITFGYNEEQVRHFAKRGDFNKTIKEFQPLREIVAGYDSGENIRAQVTINANFDAQLKLENKQLQKNQEEPGEDYTNNTKSNSNNP
jgi:hypothetical protein